MCRRSDYIYEENPVELTGDYEAPVQYVSEEIPEYTAHVSPDYNAEEIPDDIPDGTPSGNLEAAFIVGAAPCPRGTYRNQYDKCCRPNVQC